MGQVPMKGGEMRKVFGLVCAGLFVAGFASVSRAQNSSFGLKAGLNMANLTSEPEGHSYDIKTGVAMGGFLTYPLSDDIALQPELLYTQKGNEIESLDYSSGGGDYATTVIKLDYIEIPILAKYSISPGESACPFVFVGPSIGILMGAKVDSEDLKDFCKSTDIGLVLGGGVELESGVSIDLRYDMGMTKAFDEGNSKNTVISLMVGYKLPAK